MTWLTGTLVRFLLALLVLALFGGAVIVMSFFVVPEQNREVVIQLVGGINTLSGLVIGYYFGSTARRDEGPVQTEVVNSRANPIPVDTPEGGA